MSWLLTADLHLTDQPRDEYRFDIFPWLVKQQKAYATNATFILGDLTDRKDNHSAVLVNKIIDGILMLEPPVYILKGNHDYIDINNPFFRFLSQIGGIRFISEPTLIKEHWVMMIPHQPDQASFDAAVAKTPPEAVLMLHQTLEGAFDGDSRPLSGLRPSAIESANVPLVYSGDVHRPQALHCAATGAYIGSPYHVRFGDEHEPRVFLHQGTSVWARSNLHFPAPKKIKRTIRRRARDGNFFMMDHWARPQDHVKLIVPLGPEEVVDWPRIKAGLLNACEEHKLVVYGIEMAVTGAVAQRINKATAADNKTIFAGFCETEKVPDNIKRAGQELLK